MGRLSRSVLSALAALLLVWWFLRDADLETVTGHLRTVDVGYLTAAVTVSLGSMLYRAWRWRYLVAPLKIVALRGLAACVFMGWAVTAVLPGRMGEMARPVLLGRREGLSKMAVFGTVVLERGLDMLAVILLLALYLALLPAQPSGSVVDALVIALRSGGAVVLMVLAGAFIVIVLGARLPDPLLHRLRETLGRWGRVGERGWHVAASFGTGLTAPLTAGADGFTPGQLRARVLAHTVVLWGLICTVHALLLRAFGLDAPVTAVLPLVSMAVVGLAVPVPAAIGSYHNALQLGLTVLVGVETDLAIGYAIVSHAVAFLPSGTIGLVLLAREGMSVSASTGR